LAQDANEAFDAEHPASQYAAEQAAFGRILASPAYDAMKADLSRPGSAKYVRAVEKLDEIGQRSGIRRFSRYLTGAE
jgi:hypothetical protein